MTYAEQATFLADTAEVSRVRQALMKAGIAVMAESANTSSHTQRVAYAFYILNNPTTAGDAMAKGVATSAGLTTTPTDNDVEFTVNSMFNAFAGVAS